MINTQQTLAVAVNQDDRVEGPQNAPVTLLEYGDYECPYCGEAYQVTQALRQQMGNRFRFAFRNFPLTQVHPYAYPAALAAEAAGAQGKFWQMHDLLYQNQNALAPQDLMQYARQIGLDMQKFQHAVETNEYEQKIRRDMESGLQSGVQGTPTFFINGRQYEGPASVHGLAQAINEVGGRG